MAGIGASGLNRAQGAEGVDRQTAQNAAAKAGARGTDEVSLSGLAERLQGLAAKLEETEEGSPARQTRLAELTSLVAAGRYEPDAEALSDTLIEGMKADTL